MLTEKMNLFTRYDSSYTYGYNPNIKGISYRGGDGGTVRELTRYQTIKKIDMVEIDEEVVKICKTYIPQTAGKLDDSRVQIFFEDGLKFVRKQKDEYDLIIVDSTDPFGPGEGLFTKEFYGNCYKALKEDGILVNQHESPYYSNYANSMVRAHKRINEFSLYVKYIKLISLLIHQVIGYLDLHLKL